MTRVARLYGAHDLRIEAEALDRPGPGEVLLRMAAAGICGSDLHYYHHGGFGPVRVRAPIIPGHEAAGLVVALGEGVAGPSPGTLVAVNPSQPCGVCEYCRRGLPIHCLEMRFMGSAMRLPHTQGMFRDLLVVPATQLVPLPAGTPPAEAACAEPLAVCLHAVAQARGMLGDLAGRRVLITGAGPIGLLTLAAMRHAGVRDIAVTDRAPAALARARAMGAALAVDVADPAPLEPLLRDRGQVDLAFECSGAPAALQTVFAAIRPRGTIIQVGVAGDVPVPLNALVGKEVAWRGSQRFHDEFATAADLIGSRRIDVRPILSHTLPLEDARAAFDLASDRATACKVQLVFAAGEGSAGVA